jgi:hypothetical protein
LPRRPAPRQDAPATEAPPVEEPKKEEEAKVVVTHAPVHPVVDHQKRPFAPPDVMKQGLRPRPVPHPVPSKPTPSEAVKEEPKQEPVPVKPVIEDAPAERIDTPVISEITKGLETIIRGGPGVRVEKKEVVPVDVPSEEPQQRRLVIPAADKNESDGSDGVTAVQITSFGKGDVIRRFAKPEAEVVIEKKREGGREELNGEEERRSMVRKVGRGGRSPQNAEKV